MGGGCCGARDIDAGCVDDNLVYAQIGSTSNVNGKAQNSTRISGNERLLAERAERNWSSTFTLRCEF